MPSLSGLYVAPPVTSGKVFKFSVVFLLTASLVTGFTGCKSRKEGGTATAKGTNEDCSRILTEKEQIDVVNAASKIFSDAITGKISVATRNQQMQGIVAGFASSQQKKGAVQATMAQASDLVSSGWLFGIASTWNHQSRLTAAQLSVLESMGVSQSLASAYVDDVADYIRPHIRVIIENGFKLSTDGRWSFTGDVFHVNALSKSADNMAAFVAIYGPKVAAALRQSDRLDAVVIDGSVFLAPDELGSIPVMEKSRWDAAVQHELKSVASDTEKFIKATKEASSYSNLMQGRIVEWFGGERGYKGKTAPEIEAQTTFKSLLNSTQKLSTYLGTGPEMRTRMLELRKTLLAIESKSIQDGLDKLASAEKAAIAAPFVPLVIWAAPFAGGVMGPAWAGVIGNASATLALTPLVFAAGSATIAATIKSATLGGSFLCNLYGEYTNRSTDALVTAPFMAAIPAVGALSAGAIATASAGSICAGTAYGTMNLGVTVFMIKSLITSGVQGLNQCYSLAAEADEAGKAGNGALAQAKVSEAMTSCADAGISLGFGLVQTGRLSKQAIEAIRQKNLKPLLGGNCLTLGELALGEGGCGSATKEERKPLPTVEEFAKVTISSERLHKNISTSERHDVIKNVNLEMTQSAPGHDYLRSPDKVVQMGQQIAQSSDRGLAMFQGKDKMVLNVYTNGQAKVTGVEVLDGNHRFAAGIYAERVAPGKGWKTIGDIPKEFVEVRVNGFNTSGQKVPRWIPLHTVKEGSFPSGSWREIPPEWGAKGPTAEVAGDVSSASNLFQPHHRGVSLGQVLKMSLNRIGLAMPGQPQQP